jgi:ABC-type methionine transport system ATPase subunit
MKIDIENLSKKEKINELEYNILSDLNFSIENNEIVGIYGDSDNEMLSLYNVLIGLEKPMIGTIKYDNEIIDLKNYSKVSALRRKIGIVDYFGLLNNISAKENILLPLTIDSTLNMEDKYNEIASLFEINTISNIMIKDLSTFEKVKISMAQAYIKGPEIIIFQNVFQELSFTEINIIKSLILKIKNCSIIIFFKMFEKLFDICETIYILFCGMFIEKNKTYSILYNPVSSITRKIINQHLIGIDYSSIKDKQLYEIICISKEEHRSFLDLVVEEKSQIDISNTDKVVFLDKELIFVFFSLNSDRTVLDSIIKKGFSVYIL